MTFKLNLQTERPDEQTDRQTESKRQAFSRVTKLVGVSKYSKQVGQIYFRGTHTPVRYTLSNQWRAGSSG